jgi:uncharacterized protein YcbK (DUF882 family)
MTRHTKQLLQMLFIGSDGKLSFTALFAGFAFVVMVTLYIKGLLQGYEVSAHWLDWSILIVEVAVLGRVGQKVLMEGVSAIATIKKPKADHLPDARKTIKTKPSKADSLVTGEKVNQPAAKTLNRVASGAHFSLEEFNSKDGAPMPASVKKNVVVLMAQLEIIREALGNKPITISSGYRSPEHNAKVDGASDSQHMKGKAADIKVRGLRPYDVARTIKRLMDEGRIIPGGLKAYPTFTHYDIRGHYTTWKG